MQLAKLGVKKTTLQGHDQLVAWVGAQPLFLAYFRIYQIPNLV